MQNLKTKDGRNLKIIGIVAMPWGMKQEWTTVFVCVDKANKNYEPVLVPFEEVKKVADQMEESKGPKICNHCQGSDVIYHVWGRTTFYSCKDCKQEVKEQVQDQTSPSAAWDPKTYGFSTTDFSFTLPQGTTIDLDAFHGNDSLGESDWA